MSNTKHKKKPQTKEQNVFKSKQKTLFERQRKLRVSATPSEMRLKDLLIYLDEYFIFQKGFISGSNYCIVDFYLPKRKLCIEVDGGCHNDPAQQIRDKYRDNYLRKERGFKVLHITNDEANTISKQNLKLLLQ